MPKRKLVSIVRDPASLTAVIVYSEGGADRAARFSKSWSDEQAMKFFEVESAKEAKNAKG
ncbi:MAG: hypothetical protein AB7F40_04380 [Victivallaceae bacterium]